MCIALLTSAHPHYPLILLSNRDEYINRPTAAAVWWFPDAPSHAAASFTPILSGRDLLRPVRGTWLGITRTGRIAVLTNFREDQPPAHNAVSRGEIIKKFLTLPESISTEEFVESVVDEGVTRDVGGFSLVCGRIGEEKGLAVVTNRAQKGAEVPWVCGRTVMTVGLSNSWFGDRTWPKVVKGEEGLLRIIRENIRLGEERGRDGEGGSGEEMEEELVRRCFELLSDDALSRGGNDPKDGLEKHIFELRNTILVPPLGRKDVEEESKDLPADEIAAARRDEVTKVMDPNEDLNGGMKQLGISGIYATQKQTVVLVGHDGRVRYIEKTLFDNDSNPVTEGEGTLDYTFQIESW